jgi:GNAT superfamily N-acetyltransferase
MPHDLLAAPFLGQYLLLRPGSTAGVQLPRGYFGQLTQAAGPIRATFSVFAGKLAADGFAFLDARIREHGTGPVLTCQRDGTIAGAIGPMEIMPDSQGAAQLLPQYFGVLPGYRGQGLGQSLWRAAMRWGSSIGPPTSSCKPRPAAHRTGCAAQKGWPTSA